MHKNRSHLQSDILLLITATIWGSGFIAQRLGMEHLGPFTFNALRFLLGSLVLLPVMIYNLKHDKAHCSVPLKTLLLGGGLAGISVFLGAALQQTGMVYTSAGKAGFITGLYVILVPIMGIFLKHKAGPGSWIGAIIAISGLYLLSFTEGIDNATLGDILVLIGSFCWAAHVHILGWFSPRMNTILLSFLQFLVCSLLSFLAIPLFAERIQFQPLLYTAGPLLYSGFISVGLAYTLQVIAQKNANPAHAAIVLSLEAVFALIFGVLMLHETVSARGLTGCALMFCGMIVSQVYVGKKL